MKPLAPLSHRMDGIAWAFFFTWLGIALLADIGLAGMLAGVGVIVLTAQGALFLRTGKVNVAWMTGGFSLFAISAWLFLDLKWRFAPLLLVFLGLVLLAITLYPTPRQE